MYKRLVLSLAIAAFFASNAIAGVLPNTFNFYSFSENSPTWEDERFVFSVTVTEVAGERENGGNLASFVFENKSSVESSIAQIYFDDGTLLELPGPYEINNGSGVNFTEGANPSSLPGGENIDWNTSGMGFEMAVGPSNSPQHNGIGVGETLEIIIELQGELTALDTCDAMEESAQNITEDIFGGLRIGMHVVSLDGGPSDSLVNGRPGGEPPLGIGGAVPEPTSALIWGLLGLTGMSVRRKRSK